jgi:hypothetical protein
MTTYAGEVRIKTRLDAAGINEGMKKLSSSLANAGAMQATRAPNLSTLLDGSPHKRRSVDEAFEPRSYFLIQKKACLVKFFISKMFTRLHYLLSKFS